MNNIEEIIPLIAKLNKLCQYLKRMKHDNQIQKR